MRIFRGNTGGKNKRFFSSLANGIIRLQTSAQTHTGAARVKSRQRTYVPARIFSLSHQLPIIQALSVREQNWSNASFLSHLFALSLFFVRAKIWRRTVSANSVRWICIIILSGNLFVWRRDFENSGLTRKF